MSRPKMLTVSTPTNLGGRSMLEYQMMLCGCSPEFAEKVSKAYEPLMSRIQKTLSPKYDLSVPNRLMPNWAKIYGIKCCPMLSYCTKINTKDKLPRGLESRCAGLRKEIINRLRQQRDPFRGQL